MTEEEKRGALIQGLRENLLWTREELAKQAGVSITTVTHAETGQTHIRFGTLRKLGEALGVDPRVLLHPETIPKAPAPKLSGPPAPRAPRLSEEGRRQLAERKDPLTKAWKKAVNDAQQFRSSAKERLRRELSAWRSAKEAGSSKEDRRPHLDEMGLILQEAYDVETALLRNMGGVVGSEWNTEFPAAIQLYSELFAMVVEAGLSIIPPSTADTSEGQAQESFEVEEAA